MCTVELVQDEPWRSIRLSAPKITGVHFRTLASNFIHEYENNENITTRQPKAKESLYNKRAIVPALYSNMSLESLVKQTM